MQILEQQLPTGHGAALTAYLQPVGGEFAPLARRPGGTLRQHPDGGERPGVRPEPQLPALLLQHPGHRLVGPLQDPDDPGRGAPLQ